VVGDRILIKHISIEGEDVTKKRQKRDRKLPNSDFLYAIETPISNRNPVWWLLATSMQILGVKGS
jgi:hypothetical protein